MALPAAAPNRPWSPQRFLLKPGRSYEAAVQAFQPYDQIKEEYPEARAAARALVAEGKAAGPARRTFVYVNNRLEGNALETIAAVLERGGPANVKGLSCSTPEPPGQ
jgi:glycerate-2-kinase